MQELQKALDAQGIEIVDNQKESVLGRKQLADRTKGLYAYTISVILSDSEFFVEFKKIPDDEKLNSFKGLLKCSHSHANLSIPDLAQHTRQKLITSINGQRFPRMHFSTCTRCSPKHQIHILFWKLLSCVLSLISFTSTTFTHVQDQAVKATEAEALEAEVARLRAENAELRQSSGALDASKRRVEQLEARMDELVSQKESEINAAYDERMRNYEERYVTLLFVQLNGAYYGSGNRTCSARLLYTGTKCATSDYRMSRIRRSFLIIVSVRVSCATSLLPSAHSPHQLSRHKFLYADVSTQTKRLSLAFQKLI